MRPPACAQDLATQIKFSKMYRDNMSQRGLPRRRFLNAELGEFFSGLPRGWTSPQPGCDARHLCPPTPGQKFKSIDMLSGIGGLTVGLHRCGAQRYRIVRGAFFVCRISFCFGPETLLRTCFCGQLADVWPFPCVCWFAGVARWHGQG